MKLDVKINASNYKRHYSLKFPTLNNRQIFQADLEITLPQTLESLDLFCNQPKFSIRKRGNGQIKKGKRIKMQPQSQLPFTGVE